jgi:phenylalanyl-tRNA synthetase beta chain
VQMTRPWQGSDQPWVHPNAAVAIDVDGSPVGFVAHLHPKSCRGLSVPQSTAIASLDLRALLRGGRKETQFAPLPAYPELPVDVALLVPAALGVAEAQGFLQRLGRKLVRRVELFEVYRGQGVPEGHKSLNFTVTLGADDRTLSDQDERKFLDKVRDQAHEIGAQLRG